MTDEEKPGLDEALRAALGTTPELPAELAARTARRARGVLRRPGEGTLSLRGLAYFADDVGLAALVLLGGVVYAGAFGMQLVVLFGH